MEFWHLAQNPHLIHAAVVHFPVALGLVGLPLILVAGMTKMRPAIRYACLGLYALVALGAFGAQFTGLQLPLQTLPATAQQTLKMHSFLAPYVWMPAAATAFLILLTGAQSEWFRAIFTVLAILSGLVTSGMICVTGFYGHALVYEHGAGPVAPVVVSAPENRPAPAGPPITTPKPGKQDPPKPAPPNDKTSDDGLDPIQPVTPHKNTAPAPAAEPPKSQITLNQAATPDWRNYAMSQWRAIVTWGKAYL